jgi:MFS transporter, DHA1 family, tetracycline resistance protein
VKRWPLTIIFITVFIDLMGFGIVLPVLPYYAESFGASPFTIGLLFTSYSIMQFLFTPIWGRLSDRCGRRPLIMLSLAGSCIGFFIFGMANRLSLLFIGRMISGIAGAIIPTTNAYVADITTPETRAKGMGLLGVAFGLGFVLGPVLGGLVSSYGYEKAPLLTAALAALNLVFAFFMLPESLDKDKQNCAISRRTGVKTLLQSLANPRTSLLLSLHFLVIFAVANMETTFALLNEHAYHLSARRTGYLFMLIGLSMSVAQGLMVGRAVKRFGENKCIICGTFAMIFGLALMPYAPNLITYLVIIVLLSVGAGINNPSVSGLLSRISNADEQGEIMGAAQSLSSLGRILGPIWSGFVYKAFGMQWPFLSGGLIMTMAFILSFRIRIAAGDSVIPNRSQRVAR